MELPKEIFENDFEIKKYGDGFVIDGLEVAPKDNQIEMLKEMVKRYNLHNELVESLKNLLAGVNPEDACRGKFADFRPNDYALSQKAYVGSKSIPNDEQILKAIETISKL